MPRSVRIEYEGAVYHVMSRGDHQEAIFLDEKDRQVFLETLAECCQRTGFRIHSYVLMSNHYHLLLETPEANLVDGMRWFQGTYTARFNSRHRQKGHLFQGRYKAIPVEGEEPEYFRRLSDYIHLNPARAGLVDREKADVASYEWSSAAVFAGGRRLPEWLVRERVFHALGLSNEGRQARKRFVAHLRLRAREAWASDKELAEEWRSLRRGWYIGDGGFRDRLEELAQAALSGRKRSSYRSEGLRAHDEKEALRLMQETLSALKLSLEQVRALRKNDPRKQGVAWLLKTRTCVGLSWIREQLSLGDESNIRRAVLAYRTLPTPTHQQLRRKLLHVCRD
jgi:putative transposase